MLNFESIRKRAAEKGPVPLAVPWAMDKTAVLAAYKAERLGIALPILIGEGAKIKELMAEHATDMEAEVVEASSPEEAAAKAVSLAREGKAKVLLKGALRTDQFLRPALDRERGLRTDRLLSDVFFTEDPLHNRKKLIGMSDGGVNIAPDLAAKVQIVSNAIEAFHRLGVSRPKVALLAAVEVVNEKMPATVDAAEIRRMWERGEFPESTIEGPMALDIAVSRAAAEKKKYQSEIAGDVDIFIVPNIEAGNIFGKSFTYYMNLPVGHIIMGARVPLLIPSRTESDEDKLNSIALGCLVGG